MIHINILSKNPGIFIEQWDKERFPETEYNIQSNSTEDIDWDCVVIYQNIPNNFSFRCKAGKVIYFSGEPPMMFPCPHEYTEQFDRVVLPHTSVRHKSKVLSHGFLNWSLGYGFMSKKRRYSFNDYKHLNPQKTKLISLVSSNQMMMPGHNKRMSIIEQLQKDYPGVVDVFGRGFKEIDYKADALLDYRFHICIENSSIPYYWTEKFSDPVMALSVPIYSGCTNIEDYVGNEGFLKFDVNDYNSLKIIIEKILKDPDREYSRNIAPLRRVREIIMDEENIIPYLINFTLEESDNDIKAYQIHPLQASKGYSTLMLIIRLKRFLYRKFYSFTNKKIKLK